MLKVMALSELTITSVVLQWYAIVKSIQGLKLVVCSTM